MYEILRLKATNRRDDEEYRQYRLDVKKRLNTPFQVRFHPLSLGRRLRIRVCRILVLIILFVLTERELDASKTTEGIE